MYATFACISARGCYTHKIKFNDKIVGNDYAHKNRMLMAELLMQRHSTA
jgi:hypothetical protein